VGTLRIQVPRRCKEHCCRDSSLYGHVQTILQDLILDLLKRSNLHNFYVFVFSHTLRFCASHILRAFCDSTVRILRTCISCMFSCFRILMCFTFPCISHISCISHFRFLAFSRISHIACILRSHTVRISHTHISCGFRISTYFAFRLFAFSRFSCFDICYRMPP
jgi:hypothetical protein